MDLHIHTCLSPCGASEMVPTRIVSQTKALRIDAIGVCDHNASENVQAVRMACEKAGVGVFGGMEVTTREEIHLLALFGEDRGLAQMQELVVKHLHGANDPEVFGPQYIVDEDDYVSGVCDRLLISATDISIEETVLSVHLLGGLAIASHIDRDVFSIVSQIGFIPPGLELDALEVSPRGMNTGFEYSRFGFPIVSFSDAQQLKDIGRATTTFSLECMSFEELKKALCGVGGRKFALD
jgi:hypothetical protein